MDKYTNIIDAIIIPLCLIFIIVVTILFFRKRDFYPLNLRVPLLVVITDVWIAIFIILSHPRYADYIKPDCIVDAASTIMVVPTLMNGALFRMIYTLIAFRLQQLILRDDIPRSKIYKFAKQQNVIILYFIVIVLFAFITVPIVLYAKEHGCTTLVYYIGGALTGAYVIGFIIATIFLRKVKETLLILYEFKIVGISFLIWLVINIAITYSISADYRDIATKYLTDVGLMMFFIETTFIPLLFVQRKSNHSETTDISENTSPEYGGSSIEEEENDISLQVEQTAPREKVRGLRRVLLDSVEREAFKSFLSLEFAYENLQFWEAVNKYQNLPGKDLKEMAKKIISNFIGYQSKCAVNIPYSTSQEILSKFEQNAIDSSLFDNAQKEVYDLLRGSYRRYKLNRESRDSI